MMQQKEQIQKKTHIEGFNMNWLLVKGNEWLDVLRNSVQGKTLQGAEKIQYRQRQNELMQLIAEEKQGEVTLPDWFLDLQVKTPTPAKENRFGHHVPTEDVEEAQEAIEDVTDYEWSGAWSEDDDDLGSDW